MASLNRSGSGEKATRAHLRKSSETYGFGKCHCNHGGCHHPSVNRPGQAKIQIDDKMKAAIDAYYEDTVS